VDGDCVSRWQFEVSVGCPVGFIGPAPGTDVSGAPVPN